MTNLIVASFTNEDKAILASHKLVELESFGDITVYEKVILKKDLSGNITALQTNSSEGLRTVSGMTLGTVIGAFAGPVGMLVGMLSGTLVGATLEMGYMDFSDDFTDKVSAKLRPGSVAVVAEVYEESPDFVDNAMESLSGSVLRANVDDVYDDYVDDQVEEIDEDIAAERKRVKTAAASEKSKIQQKIEQLKQKRHKRMSELKGKQQSTVEKIKTSITESKKSRLRNRIYNHQARIAELETKLKEMERN
jgi:uncharacterized membrane protein